MADNIDTRITLSLHPDNVKEVDGYSEETAAVLAPTETAFSTAYEGLRKVYDARAAADKNPAWTEEARIIQVDAFASKHLNNITRTFDTTRTRLEQGIASIEQELSQPVTARAAHPIASEIRAHVKGMSTGERQSFLQQAMDAGDHDTVTAILGAPPYLSGMNAEMQKIMLRFWHEKQNPALTRRLKAMQGAKALIEERAGLVFSELEKAVGGTSHKAKRLREAQAAAEKAFVIPGE